MFCTFKALITTYYLISKIVQPSRVGIIMPTLQMLKNHTNQDILSNEADWLSSNRKNQETYFALFYNARLDTFAG